ncbi:unnamed protein product [Spirodela intermedia]|uniref:Bromo domain-containing protein n=1 Tax=Spirodela intermedia TaxID=51605 RepID=A0A7I8K461_SPIIN|nr:unnamed protein product [Spirodela intermedia]
MGKPVEKKRKKKGRPSLLDLQKRSLRLQKQQEEQQQEKRDQNPSPNPYVRFPNSTPSRRTARRSTEPDGDAEDGEDDEEEGGGKRREKKLKLVLRLHQNNGIISKSDNAQEGHSDSESSGPESKGDGDTPRKEKKIDAVGSDGSIREKTERCSSSSKAMGGELLDPGLTTPLPDRKLLIFILDRLQKKDTYGVFSEPVDPTELPDYHDVITHPMDFGTVRKRLSSGYYSNLEMFEKDVFLICTNAMSYNAPDTIYFRQARSIHELAKKDFENLRQDSDEDEPEPRIVRRGRPPGKSSAKKTVGRPPNDRASLDFSPDATLANAGDNLPWSNSSHDNHRLVNGEVPAWMGDKSDRSEDPGSMRGIPMRFGKKVAVLDENRRHTYKQPQLSKGWHESSVLATLDGEKKQLVPVGFHGEHAYARSLARYAATLGPAGWEIAARQIEKALPPGTKFGRGWIGEPDPLPQQYQSPLLSTSPLHTSSQLKTPPPPSPVLPKGEAAPERPDGFTAAVAAAAEDGRHARAPPGSSPAFPGRSGGPSYDGGGFSVIGGSGGGAAAAPPPKAPPPFQLQQHSTASPLVINGFSAALSSSSSQFGRMLRPAAAPLTHAGALEMVSRGADSSVNYAAKGSQPEPGDGAATGDPRGSWRGLSLRSTPESAPPPDLNIRFQSPSSPPAAGGVADSQQPDLALQL